MDNKPMLLGTVQGESYGSHPGECRMPWADTTAYTNVDVHLRAARTAERGGLNYLFYPDRVFV